MPDSESIGDLPSTDVFGPFNSDSDVNQWIDDMQAADWPGKFLITSLQEPPDQRKPDTTIGGWQPYVKPAMTTSAATERQRALAKKRLATGVDLNN